MALSSCSCRSRFPKRFKLLLVLNGHKAHCKSRANCEMDKLNDVIIVHISLHSRRRHRSLRLFSFFSWLNLIKLLFRSLHCRVSTCPFVLSKYTLSSLPMTTTTTTTAKRAMSSCGPKMLQYLQFYLIEAAQFH